MFNLYANSISSDGFLGLVSKNVERNNKEFEINNRKILSGFAVVSLLIISVIANGSQYQANFELQKQATIASYSNAI